MSTENSFHPDLKQITKKIHEECTEVYYESYAQTLNAKKRLENPYNLTRQYTAPDSLRHLSLQSRRLLNSPKSLELQSSSPREFIQNSECGKDSHSQNTSSSLDNSKKPEGKHVSRSKQNIAEKTDSKYAECSPDTTHQECSPYNIKIDTQIIEDYPVISEQTLKDEIRNPANIEESTNPTQHECSSDGMPENDSDVQNLSNPNEILATRVHIASLSSTAIQAATHTEVKVQNPIPEFKLSVTLTSKTQSVGRRGLPKRVENTDSQNTLIALKPHLDKCTSSPSLTSTDDNKPTRFPDTETIHNHFTLRLYDYVKYLPRRKKWKPT